MPHGHWKTTAFIAGLRRTGIIAPLVPDGPMTGRTFCAHAQPVLSPGDVVVLDNPAARKLDAIKETVAAVGASLPSLPPCSPDLDPIEQPFAKLKALLRNAATSTEQQLRSAIGQLRPAIPPPGCAD